MNLTRCEDESNKDRLCFPGAEVGAVSPLGMKVCGVIEKLGNLSDSFSKDI